MKKPLLILIALSLVLVLCGCAQPVYTTPKTSPKTTETTLTSETPTIKTTTPATTSSGYGNIDINMASMGTWGFYGELIINDYRAGNIVKKSTKGHEPFYVINRINATSESGILTTEPNKTTADIPLRKILHSDSLSSVTSIRGYVLGKDKYGNTVMTPELTSEKIIADSYNPFTRILKISGLNPDSKRGLKVNYIPDSEFVVKCVIDEVPDKGYVEAPKEIVDWVEFDSDILVLKPDSYAPIWMTLGVPEGTSLPPHWEFWVEVSLSSGKQASGVMAQIRYRMSVKVDMAQ